MKDGNYAMYKGKEYSADNIKDKGIVLRSYDKVDVENGFVEYDGYNKQITCIKFVSPVEIDAFYRVETRAIYNGYEFIVVEEKEEEISIVTMKGDYRVWEGMGMKLIDKGVYQKWIRRNEAEIIIEKTPL